MTEATSMVSEKFQRSTADPPISEHTYTSGKVFLTAKERIYVADLGDEMGGLTSIPSTVNTVDIKYDSVARKIYWSDWTTNRVYRANVNGTDREVVTYVNGHVPRSIDIADNSSTLYMAYGTPRKVISMSIASGTEMPGIEMEFLTLGEGYPVLQAIMVDEEQGYLYMSMMNYKIIRTFLNNTGNMDIIDVVFYDSNLIGFTGISIDVKRNVRRIFLLTNEWQGSRIFYKDVALGTTDNPESIVELTDYVEDGECADNLIDVNYFNGALYWIRRDSPACIGIMQDYDHANRSYTFVSLNTTENPNRMHIASIEP